jgi:hypothetical protein
MNTTGTLFVAADWLPLLAGTFHDFTLRHDLSWYNCTLMYTGCVPNWVWLCLWWSHSNVEPVISCMDCAEDDLLLVRWDRSAKCIIVRCATTIDACAMHTFSYKADRNVPAANARNLECLVPPSYVNPSCLPLFAAIAQDMALASTSAFY